MAIGGVVIQFKADADKARKDIAGLTRTLDGVDKSASKQSKTMGKFAKMGIGAVVAGASAGVFGLVRMGTAAITMAADFEQSQNVLRSNLGASSAQMAKLDALAKQLGMSTSFSALDASAAMVELAKAGLSTSQILDGAVAASMALAATEGMDLATASVYMANAMAMFGIKAKDAGKVADILAAGSVASTASVEGLAQGLKYVGATAKSLDAPLLDTVTALAALNNVGLDSSTAGTSLNRMFLGMATQGAKASKLMKQMGLDFTTANGAMIPMEEAIRRLTAETAEMTKPERAKALKTLFGVEGMRAAVALLDLGASGYGKLREQVDQTGLASEMAAARMAGFWGALETAKGAIGTLGISIGEKLLPILTGWVTDFTDFLESPEGQAWAASLATTIETAANNVKTWVEGTLMPALESVKAWFASPDGKAAMAQFATDLQVIAGAIGAVSSAIGTLIGQWTNAPGWLKTLIKLGATPLNAMNQYNNAVIGAGQSLFGGGSPKPSGLPTTVAPRRPNDNDPRTVINVTNNYPKPEKPSESVALSLRIARNLTR